MNYSEVKELLQAGFTADEIRTMMNPQENNPQNSQINPQPEQPEQTQPEQQEQTQQEQPEPQQDDSRFNQLNATMEKLIKTIQSSNLNNSSFDSIAKPDLNAEVDKIMAGIIRPERDKKEV